MALAAAVVAAAAPVQGSGGARAADPAHAPVVRGVVRAIEQPMIATEAALKAVELPFREGQAFRRGDTLALFDCRRQQAELAAARAAVREAELTLESLQHLDRHRAVGRNDVEIARVRHARALAEAAALAPRLDECRLEAPFDGRVVELTLRVHERTAPQRPFVTILDTGRLEVELIAPSAMLPGLAAGARFMFTVDELARRPVAAEIARAGAVVDPVSKTAKLIARLLPPWPGELLPGMSGTAELGKAAP